MGEGVRVKKRCCGDTPRCKRCPLVWKRLAAAGLAERESKRRYQPAEELRKRDLKAARQ